MPNNKVKIKEKDKVGGKVVKTTLSGALVDIGLGKPAVIPISLLQKEKVKRVGDVLKEGQEIEAWVKRIQADGEKVELTLIEPLMLEWQDIKKGEILKGKIERIEKFGAFVNLGSEKPGLIHVSELSHDYIRSPEDVVKVGDEIDVKVLEVDRRKKQIKLSIKALHSEPAAIMQEEAEKEEPAPTAMESALRKAMDQEDSPVKVQDSDANSGVEKDSEMDELLTRTLENRVRSK